MDSYFFGFSLWKRKHILNFFSEIDNAFFCDSLTIAIKKGLKQTSKVYIWGKKDYKDVEEFCFHYQIKVYRVEDGFIRSVSLGSDLTKAYSLVVDSRGIYFDPTSSSDLEYIIQTYKFDDILLQRAKYIKQYLVDKKLSKYNIHKDKKLKFDTTRKIIVVVGQVEDDASIIYGGDGMSNLELLQKVYQKRQNEYIIYKPHPDVEVGNRKGKISKEIVLNYANEVLDDVSLPSLLDVCDELHTITSLSGFEALLRDKDVYTYGMPFYAGWGLTIDEKVCDRRDRDITLLELIAATYIIYPRYLSPIDNSLCEVEELLSNLELMKKRYNNKTYKFIIDIRNIVSRLAQWGIRRVYVWKKK